MDIIAAIAEELQIKKGQAEAAVKLIDEGNTIPFIANIASLRYFGANTMRYLQFQRARLSISSFFCVPNMDIPPLLLFLRSANLLRL